MPQLFAPSRSLAGIAVACALGLAGCVHFFGPKLYVPPVERAGLPAFTVAFLGHSKGGAGLSEAASLYELAVPSGALSTRGDVPLDLARGFRYAPADPVSVGRWADMGALVVPPPGEGGRAVVGGPPLPGSGPAHLRRADVFLVSDGLLIVSDPSPGMPSVARLAEPSSPLDTLWSCETAEPAYCLIFDSAASEDGRRLAVAYTRGVRRDPGAAHPPVEVPGLDSLLVVDARSGERIVAGHIPFPDPYDAVRQLAWYPDGGALLIWTHKGELYTLSLPALRLTPLRTEPHREYREPRSVGRGWFTYLHTTSAELVDMELRVRNESGTVDERVLLVRRQEWLPYDVLPHGSVP